MVIFLSSSFLKRTVCTPDIALTTVDFPCATCPIVPIFMVACRAIISGVRGVKVDVSRVLGSGCSGSSGRFISGSGSDFLSADFGLEISDSSMSSSLASTASSCGDSGSESSDGKSPFVAILQNYAIRAGECT